jgi:hypothetical protein
MLNKIKIFPKLCTTINIKKIVEHEFIIKKKCGFLFVNLYKPKAKYFDENNYWLAGQYVQIKNYQLILTTL